MSRIRKFYAKICFSMICFYRIMGVVEQGEDIRKLKENIKTAEDLNKTKYATETQI